MKNPKKPTREQKKIMANRGLDWKNWLVISADLVSLTILNKKSGRIRVIFK